MVLRKFAVFLFVLLIGLYPLVGQASPVTIDNLRMWRAPDHTRLVFDLSGPIDHKLFSLSDPNRVVLDMNHVELKKSLPVFKYDGPLIAAIRTGKQDDGLRIVLDMKESTNPRTYMLKPYGQYGYRLVIDLYEGSAPLQAASTEPAPPKPDTVYNGPAPRSGPIIVAIDPGHGGEDPGAIGPRYHTREKDVVLSIAKDLKKLIDRDPDLTAVMTRTGDYFVPLRRRIIIAQQKNAELFVSIHADSLPHSHARGSSVYALSQRGASSAQARLLANRENDSDLIGGIDLSETDDVLAKVLVDMTQTAIIASSVRFGQDMLQNLSKVGPIHIKNVGLAGFAVLKSAKFPSILVETAFISHPGEERNLRSSRYREKMAEAIYAGIKRYVGRHTLRPRIPTHVAVSSNKPTFHIVRRGDTLSEIAATYSVNVTALKFANNLHTNKLVVGKRLVIPN